MFESSTGAEQTISRGPHELRVAVFDLSKRALVSPSYTQPALFQDFEPYNDNGLIGISHETRAVNLGSRLQNRNGLPIRLLPPMDALGSLTTETPLSLSGYAVTSRQPIDFRNFSAGFKYYDIEEVYKVTQKELEQPDSTSIDTIDAELLYSGFKHIRALGRLVNAYL